MIIPLTLYFLVIILLPWFTLGSWAGFFLIPCVYIPSVIFTIFTLKKFKNAPESANKWLLVLFVFYVLGWLLVQDIVFGTTYQWGFEIFISHLLGTFSTMGDGIPTLLPTSHSWDLIPSLVLFTFIYLNICFLSISKESLGDMQKIKKIAWIYGIILLAFFILNTLMSYDIL